MDFCILKKLMNNIYNQFHISDLISPGYNQEGYVKYNALSSLALWNLIYLPVFYWTC